MPDLLILVHGVGRHPPGKIDTAVRAELTNRHVQELNSVEVNWSCIDSPGFGKQLRGLGRSFWSAGWIGIDAALEGPRTRTLLTLWRLAPCFAALLAISAVWWLLACGGSLLPTASIPPLRVGLPVTAIVFPPLNAEYVAGSQSLATSCARAIATVSVIYSLTLALLTWRLVALPLGSVVRLAFLQLAGPVVYGFGLMPFFILLMAASAVVGGIANTLLQPHFAVELADGNSWFVGPGISGFVRGFGIAGVLSILVFVLGIIVSIVLKPVADVLRYLGDHAWRQKVQNVLCDVVEDKVKDCAVRPRVILAGHSLGSVIIVDSLLSRPKFWSQFRRVDLLTMGSPLQRLLWRFFPSAYPPPATLADMLFSTYPGLSWTNIYRCTDYIGGRLASALIFNRRLIRDFLHFHGGYFSDPLVIDELLGIVARTRSDKPNRICPRLLPCALAEVEHRLGTRNVARFQWIPVFCAVGALVIVVSQFILVPLVEKRNLAFWYQEIDAAGAVVLGEAVRTDAVDYTAEGPAPVYETVVLQYTFGGKSYSEVGEVTIRWYQNILGPLVETSDFPHVDWKGLVEKLKHAHVDRATVEVNVSVNQPGIFRVSGYTVQPAYHTVRREIVYALRTVLLLLVWSMWVTIYSSLYGPD